MASDRSPVSRWWLVAVAAALMGITGSYQFLWSSIRGPLGGTVGASETVLGTVFTLYVVTQTLAQFPGGWVRDRWGPRLPLLVAAVLLAGGFVGTSMASTPAHLVVLYTIGGIGAGIGYSVAVNTPVKWFTDRRGLATGVVTMTFGGLSFLLIPAVRRGVRANLEVTLVGLGVLAGVTTLGAAVVLRDPAGLPTRTGGPSDGGSAASGGRSTRAVYTWRETVRTRQFWLLYGIFVVINGVGIMVIGKAIAFAEVLELTSGVATASASIIALADSAGVFVGSGASDRYGRVRTAATAVVLTGVGIAGAVAVGAAGYGVAFVALIGTAAFFRSPAFAIFPVLVSEYYGERHSSTNYAALYTAKIFGAVLGGAVASSLILGIGWSATFLVASGLAVVAGVAMWFVRPP